MLSPCSPWRLVSSYHLKTDGCAAGCPSTRGYWLGLFALPLITALCEEAGSDEEYEYDGDTTDDTDDDRVDDSLPARAVYDEKAELAAAVVGSEREAELEAAAAIDPPEQVQRASATQAVSTQMGVDEMIAKDMACQEFLQKEKEASANAARAANLAHFNTSSMSPALARRLRLAHESVRCGAQSGAYEPKSLI